MMQNNATRLTLYALITAIEEDLRGHIVANIGHETDVRTRLGDEIHKKVFERLQKDQNITAYATCIKDLIIYFDYADAFQILNSISAVLSPQLRSSLQANTPNFQLVPAIRNRTMHSRPLHYDDFPIIHDLSESLAVDETFWPHITKMFRSLAKDPSSVLSLVIPDPDEEALANNLPLPDFDETGLLGREMTSKALLELLRGPYPVISIIGEGGIGKTALALKTAYDVLDDKSFGFDTIVWASAKNATLGATEIIQMDGAIRDSLGLFSNISQELAGNTQNDSIEEILSYLAEFRIMLIIDNLETIIDRRIFSFLERLPNGSKVLITSRIGLGDFERRIKLGPLSENDSVHLLRIISKLRGLDALFKRPHAQLLDFCRRLKCNPGFIKWFVAVVQAGRRPEDALANPTLFLDYCLANVFEYLGPEAKLLLRVMQAIPKQHSLAELAYYSELEIGSLQPAVQSLLSTNMVLMSAATDRNGAETCYILSELTREYLLKRHPLSEPEAKSLRSRSQALQSSNSSPSITATMNEHSIYTIDAQTSGERITAGYLHRAMQAVSSHNYAKARDLISKARDLSPEFYEVYRVEAIVNLFTGNIQEARICYERAIELKPNSARLRLWFGGFLLRHIPDPEGAAKQYIIGIQHSPDDLGLRLEYSRALFQMNRFDEAQNELTIIGKAKTLKGLTKRKYWDTVLQLWSRKAEHHFRQHEYLFCNDSLEALIAQYKLCPQHIRDAKIAETLRYSLSLARRCSKSIIIPGEAHRTAAVIISIEAELKGSFYNVENTNSTSRKRGIIVRLWDDRKYGFIHQDSGDKLFFHYSAFQNGIATVQPCVGCHVTFDVAEGPKGKCAINCILEET